MMENTSKLQAWHFLNEFILSDNSNSSSSENEELVERGNKRQRIENFVEDVVDVFPDEEFQRNFRMKKDTFDYILNLIKYKIGTVEMERGRSRIPAKHQLLITIWYFATPDSYRSICGRFNVGMATGIRIVRRVTEALIELSSTLIRWPTDEYAEVVKRNFENKGFANTLGCIDGCYIPIPLPKEEGRAFICRKNFPCINMLAVCDHRMLFTYIYAGEAGSVHDSTVLKNCELWTYINDRAGEMFPDDSHLLGDKAYAINEQLLTPYRDNGHLTRAQQQFNYSLCSVRSTIERCFGLLKKRFRILKFMDVRCLAWIPKYILACCVLHNICILQNDVMQIDVNQEIMINFEDVDLEIINEERNRVQRERGIQKRNRLCEEMYRI